MVGRGVKFAKITAMAEENKSREGDDYGEEVLLQWEAPERAFTKRGKTYFRNLFAILLVLAAIAVFFKEFLLAGVLLALGFVQYALGTTPPRTSKHEITSHGIKTHGHEYVWEDLADFWYTEKDGVTVLSIDTKRLFPGRLFLILSGVSKDRVGKILRRYLPYHKAPHEDILERISSEFSRRFRLE